jgi:hypothetical protein
MKNKLNIIILSVLIICVVLFLIYHTLDKSKFILTDRSGKIIKYKKETFIYDTIPKKYKIIVIQDGAYNKYPEYSEYTIKINKLYCKKWNYDYKFIEHDLNKMPPYWLKVNDIVEYINKDYDYVVFLDLDASFIDFDVSLDSLINKIQSSTGINHDIYIGKDIPFNVIANTGAIIIKNNDLFYLKK